MRLLLLFFILLTTYDVQSQRFKDLFIHIDSSGFNTSERFFLDVTLIKKRGKQVVVDRTSNNWDWNKLEISCSEQIQIKKGICYYKLAELNGSNNTCTITVREEKSGKEKTIQFKLPYISKLILNTRHFIANRNTDFSYLLGLNNGANMDPGLVSLDWNKYQVMGSPGRLELSDKTAYLELDQVAQTNKQRIEIYRRADQHLLCSEEITFEYPRFANYQWYGTSGYSGSHGKNGSHPSGDATSGEHGNSGTDGESLKLFVYKETGNEQDYLVLHGIKKSGQRFYDILPFETATVNIDVHGGDGGNGGNGGQGGAGLIDAENNIDSPKGGNGGNAGSGGNAGDGGDVLIYFHENAYAAVGQFTISNEAGLAGNPGTAGKGGRGDHADTKLLGTILSLKDGADGKVALGGTFGTSGTRELLRLSEPDFILLLERYKEQGY